MNLQRLKSLFIAKGCDEIYVKRLAANDLSKSQVYLSGDFDVLNIFPISEIQPIEAGKWEKERFMASINFSWIDEEGVAYPAPKAKFILYPAYPEVRFSGFLANCKKSPSDVMTHKIEGRHLFLGVSKNGTVIGYASHYDSSLSREIENQSGLNQHGVFSIIELPHTVNGRSILIGELTRIHQQGWIDSKSLTKDGLVPCKSSQCGGYTLEAELGIVRNGFSEPDFKGWEVKSFGVRNFTKLKSSVITLFTPEPTGGHYKENGVEYFIRNYGYLDKTGRPDRMNFGGIHKAQKVHPTTGLEMKLIGFDQDSGKIRNASGRIALVDNKGDEAASWSFASMLLHWNRKHDKACYVPSVSDTKGQRKYKYGDEVIMGTGTDFQLFLSQMALGNIYYDPGIKMENMSSKPKFKKRSQFRIKSAFLPNLYKLNETIHLVN